MIKRKCWNEAITAGLMVGWFFSGLAVIVLITALSGSAGDSLWAGLMKVGGATVVWVLGFVFFAKHFC